METTLTILFGLFCLIELIGMFSFSGNKRKEEKSKKELVDTLLSLKAALEQEGQKNRNLLQRAQSEFSTSVGKTLSGMIDPPKPVGATRIYAAILTHADMHRLYIAPANDAAEFAVVGKSVVGDQWKAEVVESIDVFPPQKEIVHVPAVQTKSEKKKLNTEEFVHHLEYARDTFAESDYQKKAIDRIITSVKQKYGS